MKICCCMKIFWMELFCPRGRGAQEASDWLTEWRRRQQRKDAASLCELGGKKCTPISSIPIEGQGTKQSIWRAAEEGKNEMKLKDYVVLFCQTMKPSPHMWWYSLPLCPFPVPPESTREIPRITEKVKISVKAQCVLLKLLVLGWWSWSCCWYEMVWRMYVWSWLDSGGILIPLDNNIFSSFVVNYSKVRLVILRTFFC